ncbi:MAG: acyl-CoA dehydrogenase family protein [Acidimicrobiales bacterium]
MEVTLTDDQQFFRETTDRFLAAKCDIAEVRRLAETADGFEPGYWRQGAELGWTSLLVPEGRGGGSISGHGVVDLTVVADAFGRRVAPGPLIPTNVVAGALAAAEDGGHADLLGRLLSGEAVAAWCGADHALGEGLVQARRDGDTFTLSGSSTPVEAAAQAEALLVTARCDGDLVQFVVPGDHPGVTTTPLAALDPVRRFARVDFADAAVGAEAVLRSSATVAEDIERQLQHALVMQAAVLVGAAERTFEFTLEWSFDRYSFGRPLASYQELKHRFADMKMWLEASHALAAALAREVQAGAPGAAETASATKAYLGTHLAELMQDCVQMHGGIGLTTDHDLHLYLRRVTAERSLFGTPTQHRQRVAAIAIAAHRGEGTAA